MRTRFLALDFFSVQTLASPSDASSLFLPFPVPAVPEPPPPPQPATEAAFCGFDHLELSLSYEFDGVSLGSEEALAFFLDEVLPWSYGYDGCGRFPAPWLSTPKCGPAEKEDMETPDSIVIPFESPEPLDHSLDNSLVCEEGKGILLEYPHAKIRVDDLHVKYKDVIPFPQEILESVYSIDELSTFYNLNCSMAHMEDNDGVKNKKPIGQHKILRFEELDIDLETSSTDILKGGFQSLLSDIELHQCTNTDFGSDVRIISEFDVFNDIQHSLSEEGGKPESFLAPSICHTSLLEFDFVSLPKNREADGPIFPLPITIHFAEVDVLDLECFQTFDYAASWSEVSVQIYGDDVKFLECTYDNLVNDEMALTDSHFVSFPVPSICDTEDISSLFLALCRIISSLKEHSASACDEIYLDWHLLQEDTCNNHIWSTCNHLLCELSLYESIESIKLVDQKVLLDFVLCGDSCENLDSLASKEVNERFLPVVSPVLEANTETEELHLTKNEKQQKETRTETVSENSHESSINPPHKITINLESITRSSDLSFFLSARKCPNGRSSEDKMDSNKLATSLPTVPDPIFTYDEPEVKRLSGDIEVHSVKLSQDILDLIDNLGKFYLRQLKNRIDTRKNFTFEDELDLLRLSKQELKDLIRGKMLTSSFEDNTVMEYVELYVIKQMACYICFYGIASCQQYLEHLFLHFKSLIMRLSSICNKIKDAHEKTEKKIIAPHPSFSAFEEILQSVSIRGKNKLIIAEKIIWWSLGRMLTAMGLSYQKFDECRNCDTVPEFVLEALNHSTCLLISHEHISVSFPFDKFGLIMEYKGACDSSKISYYSSEIRGLTQVHFIKVELDELSVASAFCEGFNTIPHVEGNMKDSWRQIPERKEVAYYQQQLELLDFVPILKDTYVSSLHPSVETRGSVWQDSPDVTLCDKHVQFRNESLPYAPDTIVIVNTGNFEKEMVISRRSSYQNILKLEKEGVQVVEREYELPVDIIFSAGSCLVWYKQQDLASSSLIECMENIATRTLMSISFAFSGCFLVFEGDSRFLDAVMDSADGLYAAAASLDIRVQLFCSYSLDLTDEIILNCIRNAKAINSGLHSLMPESESLGESFLTSFPSINPLYAHAILSSVGTLKDLLNCSHEERLQSLKKYLIPQENTSIFSDLCRYGELGESKSGTTDCSSISSAIDSGNSSCRMHYKRKSQNVTGDDCATFDSENIQQGGSSKNTSTEQPVTYREPSRQDFLLQNKYSERNRGRVVPETFGTDCCYGNSTISAQDTGSGEIVDCNGSELENVFSRSENFGSARRRLTFNMSDYPTFPSLAEVDHDYTMLTSSKGHESIESKEHEVTTRNSAGWRPQFSQLTDSKHKRISKSKNAMYSSLTEFDCIVDGRPPCRDNGKLLKDDVAHEDLLSGMDAFPIEQRRDLFGDRTLHGYGRNHSQKSTELSSGRKLLSSAIHAAQMHQGSPWTIEFLNRIKEKTKKHQEFLQSLQCNTCVDFSLNSEKNGRYVSRQSPSCLDSYKYRGASRDQKVVSGKQQKRRRESLDFGNIENVEKPDQHSMGSWTPLDKRARQVLSYARNGNEKQSKLVWRDGHFRTLGKKRPS